MVSDEKFMNIVLFISHSNLCFGVVFFPSPRDCIVCLLKQCSLPMVLPMISMRLTQSIVFVFVPFLCVLLPENKRKAMKANEITTVIGIRFRFRA